MNIDQAIPFRHTNGMEAVEDSCLNSNSSLTRRSRRFEVFPRREWSPPEAESEAT